MLADIEQSLLRLLEKQKGKLLVVGTTDGGPTSTLKRNTDSAAPNNGARRIVPIDDEKFKPPAIK